MKISKTNFVEVNYRLKEEKESGKVIEETFGKEPLGFVFGVGMMIPGFETEIEGLEANDKKSFLVIAEEAYGLYNEDQIVPIPKQNFGSDEEQKEHLFEGNQIAMHDQAGRQHIGLVKELKDDQVFIDFNHPMAGLDLFFEVEILSIRETTREELQEMGLQFEG
jgi:FKBP-type peptidyl-prolyl cis-trans isomerase SlyD